MKNFFDFKVTAVLLVLSFGVLFLYGAAEELFDLNGDGMVIVLPFTLYLIPGCIYSLNHINRQINDSLSQIVKYIINIFSICMIVMGYGYVLKLILMQIYSVAVPGINMYSVSSRSQKYFLDRFLRDERKGRRAKKDQVGEHQRHTAGKMKFLMVF